MPPVEKKPQSSDEDSNLEPRRKRKRSRWAGDESDKTFIPGMPTIIPSSMTPEQEKAYLIQLRIEDITRSLRTGDLGIPARPEDRSPSPEPQYDSNGKRLNTREVRVRKRLEDERHSLVMQMLKINNEYKPPADYKPPANKHVEKVYIPQDEHPDINFVGLLIGPRGNTLKMLEKETNAKIIIRGRGSVKEGKIGWKKDGLPMPGEDEQLHAYITGNTPEIASKAAKKVREIIEQGINVPECMNDLRRQQLRELALLNGTLRENDTLNKLKVIDEAKTIITNQIICQICGGAGHISSDCKLKNSTEPRPVTWEEREKMDNEYLSLLHELGQGPAPDPKIGPGQCIISSSATSSNAPLLPIEETKTSSTLISTPPQPNSSDLTKTEPYRPKSPPVIVQETPGSSAQSNKRIPSLLDIPTPATNPYMDPYYMQTYANMSMWTNYASYAAAAAASNYTTPSASTTTTSTLAPGQAAPPLPPPPPPPPPSSN